MKKKIERMLKKQYFKSIIQLSFLMILFSVIGCNASEQSGSISGENNQVYGEPGTP